jgi:uncharacterized protein (TIGR03118 family)
MLNNRFSHISLSLLTALLCLVSTQPSFADPKGYQIHKLVSSISGEADNLDADLINAWGIVFNPDGFVWVNDGGTGKSTLYNGDGTKIGLVVTIPSPTADEPSKPTGIVYFGGNSSFIVKDNPADPTDKGAPSRFIFATENGTIAGWAPTEGTQPPPSTVAIEMVNNSAKGSIYKGLALSADGNRYLLFATDFHNNKVDVFDDKFQPVALAGNAFKDIKIPPGFAPFGIQAINGVIYVTYAKQDENKEDDVAGPGLGYINAYDTSGHLVQRVAMFDKLNAPWGLAMAPANFGKFSNHLLVSNFGDGTIVAYDLNKHLHDEGKKLHQTDGKIIHIPGLWGISFGNGLLKQATNALFFTAGPNHEADGLYGKIEAVSGK